MKRLSKPIKITIITVSSILALLITLGICFYLYMYYAHNIIINSKPDTSSWVLENDEFTVVPEIDKYVTFTVKNKQDNIIYECDTEWRAWDFKTINIDDENNIIIFTGDMGEERYIYTGETWSKDTDYYVYDED